MATDKSSIAVRPLPGSVRELLEQRKTSLQRTLNDRVEEVHLRLFERDEYKDLLAPVWDEQASEGSLTYENFKAAEMIRNEATQDPVIARQKLKTLVRSLEVVLRRYCISRKERRYMVGGTVVPPPANPGVEAENGD